MRQLTYRRLQISIKSFGFNSIFSGPVNYFLHQYNYSDVFELVSKQSHELRRTKRSHFPPNAHPDQIGALRNPTTWAFTNLHRDHGQDRSRHHESPRRVVWSSRRRQRARQTLWRVAKPDTGIHSTWTMTDGHRQPTNFHNRTRPSRPTRIVGAWAHGDPQFVDAALLSEGTSTLASRLTI